MILCIIICAMVAWKKGWEDVERTIFIFFVDALMISLNDSHAHKSDDLVEWSVDERKGVSERTKFLSNLTFQPIRINHWYSKTECVYILSFTTFYHSEIYLSFSVCDSSRSFSNCMLSFITTLHFSFVLDLSLFCVFSKLSSFLFVLFSYCNFMLTSSNSFFFDSNFFSIWLSFFIIYFFIWLILVSLLLDALPNWFSKVTLSFLFFTSMTLAYVLQLCAWSDKYLCSMCVYFPPEWKIFNFVLRLSSLCHAIYLRIFSSAHITSIVWHCFS